ncbi:MFS transporter [Candidatus Hydrogenisulfobacillus filiaventi]|uniref:MFS transporter n=1 Tax=Candidatus Hydrogenisulfobacillus filiaventi TaxID=2707344 RepID=A0A6F8ZE73_9FIRM|nr:MFS transporter [Bacillota bacterium]CAB1128055.1 MFS transporter [Candidatus Hydrogenisulfobacillus filiaventi]
MATLTSPSRPAPAYKWIALSNTTLGMLMAMLNMSSLLIALPAVFRGIRLNPLDPVNFSYLLWILMGYMLVTAVLVVTFGRIGDLYGRVRMYNLGFAVFTAGSILLSLTWSTGPAGAVELIAFRMLQAVGGALLMANSAAILTDAFPPRQRGMAMGINQIAALVGQFAGLILGGLLAAVDWRWVFLVNVPVGLFGTVWAYLQLREVGERHPARIDWAGNLTFAVGLTVLLVAITYGIKPYGHAQMGWGNPWVLAGLAAGLIILGLFVWVEYRVPEPMFHMGLFRIRAFTAGSLAGLISAIGRGGLQFMLIIWLQGIWLPMHGYNYTQTPLWAGIYLLPLTAGFILAGPTSGWLSDRYGARPFATGGMLLAALTFGLFLLLPVDFSYPVFALVLFLNGIAFGLFGAPNTTAIMNSVPPRHRGAASGMRSTFQNTGMPLSIGIFFSLMIAGLSASVPPTLFKGLTANGVPAPVAAALSRLPPVSYLFAAFLGYNPLGTLLGPRVLAALPPESAARLTGRTFFPSLIAGPFRHGLVVVFTFSIAMSLIAAGASWMRGGRFIYEEEVGPLPAGAPEQDRPDQAGPAAGRR